MGWLHRTKDKKTADMDIRITRAVLKKLRAAGYAAAMHDKRDVGGARLHPATAKCGQCWIVVRRVSDVLQPPELRWIADNLAYVQWGSDDISGLLLHLAHVTKPHWNA